MSLIDICLSRVYIIILLNFKLIYDLSNILYNMLFHIYCPKYEIYCKQFGGETYTTIEWMIRLDFNRFYDVVLAEYAGSISYVQLKKLQI